MCKVSVIIPVYNTEKYLRKCLDSVCNQTLSDIEIICINDCSLDNSLEILNEYASKDNRIKVINFQKNKGVSVARNKGIDTAQGEYIGFVDSDDFIDLDFYEKLYKKAKETDADAVKGKLLSFSEKNGIYVRDFYDNNHLIKQHYGYFLYGFTSAIYKRKFIVENEILFPEGLINSEDPCFSVKAATLYKKVEILNDVNYYYTDNFDSVTKNINKDCFDSSIKAFDYILDLLKTYNVSDKQKFITKDSIFNQLLYYCLNYNCNSSVVSLATKKMAELLEETGNLGAFLEFHFSEIKKRQKEDIFKKLREKMRLNK